MSDITDWIVKPNAMEVALFARDQIVNAAQQAIAQRGSFKLVLAGGTTPAQVYQLLAKETCDWQCWQLYLGDERCLPKDHAERNSQMVQRTWLNTIDFPADNIHFIESEKGAKAAAMAYEAEIVAALPFDLVLLGMGEDGHTASLFPQHSYTGDACVQPVFNAPKPPAERVSLSRRALSCSQSLLIIVTGSGKQEAVLQWRKGKGLPVAQIGSLGERVVVLDQLACQKC